MRYRKLGRAAVDVAIIGLGAEYLEHASRDTVIYPSTSLSIQFR